MQFKLRLHSFIQLLIRAFLQAGTLIPAHIAWLSAALCNHGMRLMTPSILPLSCLQSQYHIVNTAKFYCHLKVDLLPIGSQLHQLLCANTEKNFLRKSLSRNRKPLQHSKFSNGVCISYSSVVMRSTMTIKTYGRFYFCLQFQIRASHGRKVWQQMAGMVVGTGHWELISFCASTKQKA